MTTKEQSEQPAKRKIITPKEWVVEVPEDMEGTFLKVRAVDDNDEDNISVQLDYETYSMSVEEVELLITMLGYALDARREGAAS